MTSNQKTADYWYREANRLRSVLLRIAARGNDWSYPCLLANVADALGMTVADLEAKLADETE